MTTTAQQLWNDKDFLRKRMEEQSRFLLIQRVRFITREIDDQRYQESLQSALGVFERLINQYVQINGPSVIADIYKDTLNIHQSYASN